MGSETCDPFRPGFVRRLYTVKHKSDAAKSTMMEGSDGRTTGGEAMKTKEIETVYYDGRYWETMKSAARRYGVSEKDVREHLDRELFWADDSRTGIRVVCGVLSVERDETKVSFWTVLEYLIGCPTNRVAPNLLWFALWGTVVILTINCVDAVAGLILAIVMGIVKFVYAIKWEKEHPQEIKPVVYVDDGCCGGDGFFDEVSTRRREDLQFLLGIGKYSKKNW